MYDITAQAVGYLGLIFGILAYQSNTHKKILLTKAASELFFGVQYVMLGAYAGMLTNLIGVIRNCTLSRSNIRGKRQIAVTVFFLFSRAMGNTCLPTQNCPFFGQFPIYPGE